MPLDDISQLPVNSAPLDSYEQFVSAATAALGRDDGRCIVAVRDGQAVALSLPDKPGVEESLVAAAALNGELRERLDGGYQRFLLAISRSKHAQQLSHLIEQLKGERKQGLPLDNRRILQVANHLERGYVMSSRCTGAPDRPACSRAAQSCTVPGSSLQSSGRSDAKMQEGASPPAQQHSTTGLSVDPSSCLVHYRRLSKCAIQYDYDGNLAASRECSEAANNILTRLAEKYRNLGGKRNSSQRQRRTEQAAQPHISQIRKAAERLSANGEKYRLYALNRYLDSTNRQATEQLSAITKRHGAPGRQTGNLQLQPKPTDPGPARGRTHSPPPAARTGSEPAVGPQPPPATQSVAPTAALGLTETPYRDIEHLLSDT